MALRAPFHDIAMTASCNAASSLMLACSELHLGNRLLTSHVLLQAFCKLDKCEGIGTEAGGVFSLCAQLISHMLVVCRHRSGSSLLHSFQLTICSSNSNLCVVTNLNRFVSVFPSSLHDDRLIC